MIDVCVLSNFFKFLLVQFLFDSHKTRKLIIYVPLRKEFWNRFSKF